MTQEICEFKETPTESEQKGLALRDNFVQISVSDAQTISKAIIESKIYGINNPQEAFVKIMAGQELRLSPMFSVNHLYIVNQKIGLDAESMKALLFKEGYTVRPRYDDEDNPTVCEVYLYYKGKMVDDKPSRFTIEDATRAGLMGKDNWKKYPKDMLFSKALTRAARAYCSHIIAGFCYVKEELEDFEAPNFGDTSQSIKSPKPAQPLTDKAPATTQGEECPLHPGCYFEQKKGKYGNFYAHPVQDDPRFPKGWCNKVAAEKIVSESANQETGEVIQQPEAKAAPAQGKKVSEEDVKFQHSLIAYRDKLGWTKEGGQLLALFNEKFKGFDSPFSLSAKEREEFLNILDAKCKEQTEQAKMM